MPTIPTGPAAGARRALAANVTCEIDSNDEYPRNDSGYPRAALDDRRVVEARQPRLPGGRHVAPDRGEFGSKMRANLV